MFEGWENYFFLVGSAAAGLIGLLFVVVTLTAGIERSQALRGAGLYMTPTAVAFAVVLTTSAIIAAPHQANLTVAVLCALASLFGLFYAIRACIGIGPISPSGEQPHWSDVWCYGVAPAAIYFALLAASVGIAMGTRLAAPAMAALALILLLVGIRNAWDLVTWIAPSRSTPPPS